MEDRYKKRFEEALAAERVYDSLPDLAKALRDEGVGQVELYKMFGEYYGTLDPDSREYDAVFEILDLIWGGPWAKGNALYEHELTNDEVKTGREKKPEGL